MLQPLLFLLGNQRAHENQASIMINIVQNLLDRLTVMSLSSSYTTTSSTNNPIRNEDLLEEDWKLRSSPKLGEEPIAFRRVSTLEKCGCGHDHSYGETTVETINLEDSKQIVFVNNLSNLDVIKKAEVKMSVWRREYIPAFVSVLNDEAITLEDLPHFQGMVTKGDAASRLKEQLSCASCPESHGPLNEKVIDDLIQDISELVSAFADISQSSNVYVKLNKVNSNQCRLWHQDSVDFRLVTTYRGPCTEWVQPEYSLETLRNKQDDSKHAQSLTHRDVALFKGRGSDDLHDQSKPKQEGIVHRSPRIENDNGVFRLLLVLDVPQRGWHY